MDVKKRKVGRGYVGTKIASGQIHPCRKHASAKSKGAVVDWVSLLPADILCDIFSRIPTETVFSCRCVSKGFLNMISSPHFSKTRNSKLPNSNSCLIIQNRDASDLSFSYTVDLENDGDRDYIPRVLVTPPTVLQTHINRYAYLVGSDNGLLCICYSARHDLIPSLSICNPILGEFMLLPRPKLVASLPTGAFGYCPKTKLYKVIRFATRLHSEIHTVGTDRWTPIKKVPYPKSHLSLASSSLNGNLHWITEHRNPSNLICSMNLETEKWEYVHPPSQINKHTLRRLLFTMVGELSGLLCFFYVHLDIQVLELWTMKDYGVKESWSKKITLDLKSTFTSDPWGLRMYPRRVLDNGDLLLSYDLHSVVYYNTRKRTYRDLVPQRIYEVAAHVPNFIPLKDIVGEKNVEVGQREVIHRNWPSYSGIVRYVRNSHAVGNRN